ncbi:protealysin inhibitor emfourin [Sporocytophaga myxococcoides]|uniref:protealysin inhibitor emfourin n=1 Tax=Sporocytophaga myxococcoides TaxID=153721 RepID=UPI0004065B4F|nr:protealysin inhibitor emfourin [Sporocytophaga myxococcoides]
MLIEFKSDGGIAYFPGLNRSKLINTDSLNNEDSMKARELVHRCRFFSISYNEVPQRGADRKTYTISVTDGDNKNTVRVSDPIEDEALGELIGFLNKLSKKI